jgi:hypothetical protein
MPTRNKFIIDKVSPQGFELQHYDAFHRTLPVYDIITSKIMHISIDDGWSIMLYGLPQEVSPPVIATPEYANAITDQELCDLQIGFLNEIKELRDSGSICSTFTLLFTRQIDEFVQFFYNNLKHIDRSLYIDNPVSRTLNIKLHAYGINAFKKWRYYCYIKAIKKFKGEELVVKSIEDIEMLLHNTDSIVQLMTEFLENQKHIVQREYENERDSILQDLTNSGNLTPEDTQLIYKQYDKVINDVRTFDIQAYYRPISYNNCLIMGMVPQHILSPEVKEKLLNFEKNITNHEDFIVIMDEYLYKIIVNLSNNGIYFTDEQYVFFEKSLGYEDPYVTIERMFLPAMKERRLEQVTEIAKNLAESVASDATDLDEIDIKEITELILDFEQYRDQIDQLQTIYDVCTYWPSLLLPAPPYSKFI